MFSSAPSRSWAPTWWRCASLAWATKARAACSKQSGCRTFAQSEANWVVDGMPKEAGALGAAKENSLEEVRNLLLR